MSAPPSARHKKDRNKHHSSPFINVVKGVFFVVRVTLVPVSYMSAPSAVHSYMVPGKFIRARQSLATLPVSKARTNKFYIYRQCTYIRGGSKGGRTPTPPPLKLEKNMIFWRKIVIFHTKYPKNDRQSSETLASFSGLFRSEYKWILYLTTMYVYCVYPAMSKKSENLSDLNKKDRNKRHSSPFINVVKGVFSRTCGTVFLFKWPIRDFDKFGLKVMT
jgi:hypothetical protein